MMAAGKMEGEGEEEVFMNEEEQTMRVEEVIERHVGSLGISQMVQVVLVSLAWMFDSQNTLITIFTDAQPSEWRCKAEAAACRDGGGGGGVCGLPPGTWEWVGGHGSTIVAEWGLICNRKFLAAMPASLFFLGSLLGSGVYGWLADSYLGRKKAVVISCILTSATAFLTSLSPNLSIYALLRFANGFARSGIGICCLVLSTEVVGRKWRGQVGQYGFFFFTTGFLSLPLIAYPFRTSWRTLYRILSLLPLSYSLLLLPFVSESPRWLLLKGRASEAVDVLNKFARLNGRKLPQNLKLASPVDAADDFGEEAIKKKKTLWATGWAARRMVMVMLAGYGVGFVYYGVQLNVENLSFNLYLTVAINAVMEIPAVLIGSLLLGFTKRRLLFCGSIYIAGVACIACVFFSRPGRRWGRESSRGNWAQLSVEAVGFMAASTAFDVLYIYSVELFPTSVRNFSVSMLRQALMLGASMAPMLVAVGRLSPAWSFLIFGLLSMASGLLGISLPETLNAPLYDTLEQQEKEEALINSPPPPPPPHHSGLQLNHLVN